jgi:hypothetical protein
VARRAEAADAALARRQLGHLDELDLGQLEHDELGDPHPRLDGEAVARVRVQQHDAQLAPVAGVDQAGRVDDADPVPRCEAGARLHEARMAVGDRDGEAGGDGGALARAEHDALARREVEPGVALVGALRDDSVVTQTRDRELDHVAFASRKRSASATRYSA